MTPFKTLQLGVAAACLVALCPVSAGAETNKQEVLQAVRLLSAHRASHGLPPVSMDANLVRAAAVQSRAMAAQGMMSHDAAGTFQDRMRSTGIRSPAAENIGVGYNSLEHAFSGWQASHGHNINMLNPSMRRVGVARAVASNGQIFWTMVLSGH